MKFRNNASGLLAAWAAGMVLAMMLAAWSSPAAAQATRTWVSGTGDDVNPCSRTAPCKTFPGALAKTAAFGEINCIDPGGYGQVTITKSITISCESGVAGITTGGAQGIIVNVASTDTVQLKGLSIDGGGTGTDGVRMIGAGNLAIINCLIYGFRNSATSTGVSHIGASGAHILIENTTIKYNSIGVNIAPPGGGINATIDRSTLEGNVNANLQVAQNGTAVLASDTIASSAAAIIVTGNGAVISYGNNFIRNAGAPTSTLPLQ